MAKSSVAVKAAFVTATASIIVALIGVLWSKKQDDRQKNRKPEDSQSVNGSTAAIVARDITNSTVVVAPTAFPEARLQLVSVSTKRETEDEIRIDIKLLNSGTAPAMVSAARLSVVRILVIYLPLRTLPYRQEVTATYPLSTKDSALPLIAKEIEVPLSQTVPPSSTDRFQIMVRASSAYSPADDAEIRVYQCSLALAANGTNEALKSELFSFSDHSFDFGARFIQPASFVLPVASSNLANTSDLPSSFDQPIRSSLGAPPSKGDIETLKSYYRGLFDKNKQAFNEISGSPGNKSPELQSLIETWKTLPCE